MGKLNRGVAMRACSASIGEAEGKGLHCGFKASLGFRMNCRSVSVKVRPCLKDKQKIKKFRRRKKKRGGRESGGRRRGDCGDNNCVHSGDRKMK